MANTLADLRDVLMKTRQDVPPRTVYHSPRLQLRTGGNPGGTGKSSTPKDTRRRKLTSAPSRRKSTIRPSTTRTSHNTIITYDMDRFGDLSLNIFYYHQTFQPSPPDLRNKCSLTSPSPMLKRVYTDSIL